MVSGSFIGDVSNIARVMVSMILHMLNSTIGQENTGKNNNQIILDVSFREIICPCKKLH